MSFRSRFDRFASASQEPAPEPAREVASEVIRGRPHDLADETAQSAAKIEALRDKITQILGRDPVRPNRARTPTALPFDALEGEHGIVHIRRVMLGSTHRTGRGTPSLARAAQMDVLALLALDPELASLDPKRALYLDTETTGLAGGTGTVAFLVGLAFFDDDGRLVLEQLLVRNLGEEAPMLAHLAMRIRDASCLVTFNGKSFDMPLLRTRFAMARLPVPSEPPHLDLLHVARRVHKARDGEKVAGATKLGSLERRLFGFAREDDIPSGDVSACYLHFLRTGDARGLVRVVEHNAWDVSSMASLVAFYGEPLGAGEISPQDLVNVASTLKRAGRLEEAKDIATRALDAGAGGDALFVRGGIEKARGDKARALRDFEAVLASSECVQDTRVRLELAKLYEHFTKDPHRALALARAGTGERQSAAEKRLARLEKKAARLLFAEEREPADRAAAVFGRAKP